MATNQTVSLVATDDIRDIKPPLEIQNPWVLFWWALAALVVAGIICAAVKLWLKRRGQPAIVPIIPPHERARRKLEQALDLFDKPKPFCILVSDAVRLYLEERFGLQAPERTTDEFLGELKQSASLNPTQKTSLEGFLSACDLVKFARYEPQRPELEGLYNSALRLIEETEPQPLDAVSSTSESAQNAQQKAA